MERWVKCVIVSSVFLTAIGLYFREFVMFDTWIRRNRTEEHQQHEATLMENLAFFSNSNSSACTNFHELGGVLNRKPSLVFLDGQKSVCFDSGVAPKPNACYVYSIGSNGEWSFDEHIEAYGCKVYVFDPTVWYWNHKHSKNIWFYRVGLGDRDAERNEKGWKVMTLSSIRKKLNHTDLVIDYLKMDIEGNEWPVLEQWIRDGDLGLVKQLAIEIHLFDVASIQMKRKIIEQLEKTGFVRFFSRENPWSVDDFWETHKIHNPSCYELAWFNTKYYSK